MATSPLPTSPASLPSGRREIRNPRTGERIVIRLSGEETGGALLLFDLFLDPGARVPAGHTHPLQEERFTVRGGRLRFRLGMRRLEAVPGDTIVVPPGTAHWFGNSGATTAQVQVEVRPALRTEDLLAEAPALSSAGPPGRLAALFRAAAFLRRFEPEVRAPYLPPAVGRAAVRALARLAAWRRP